MQLSAGIGWLCPLLSSADCFWRNWNDSCIINLLWIQFLAHYVKFRSDSSFSFAVCASIIFPAVECMAVLAVAFAAKGSKRELIEELIINKQTDLSEIFCCILLHFPDGSLPEATGKDGRHSFRCLPWCRSSGYQSRFPHCHCKSSLFPLRREFLVKMHLEN